nr:MAG TPA: hypothetical protein [Caudoviricetes sp.]
MSIARLCVVCDRLLGLFVSKVRAAALAVYTL